MNLTYLLLLGMAIVIVIGIGALVWSRATPDGSEAKASESPFAASTEGEKVCPKCGMGNLWTSTRCISCGNPLRG